MRNSKVSYTLITMQIQMFEWVSCLGGTSHACHRNVRVDGRRLNLELTILKSRCSHQRVNQMVRTYTAVCSESDVVDDVAFGIISSPHVAGNVPSPDLAGRCGSCQLHDVKLQADELQTTPSARLLFSGDTPNPSTSPPNTAVRPSLHEFHSAAKDTTRRRRRPTDIQEQAEATPQRWLETVWTRG